MRRKIVLATGAFDLLHYGHLKFLEEAKKKGGPGSRLYVIVARDKTVMERKGSQPVLPEDQRRVLVEALKPVKALKANRVRKALRHAHRLRNQFTQGLLEMGRSILGTTGNRKEPAIVIIGRPYNTLDLEINQNIP